LENFDTFMESSSAYFAAVAQVGGAMLGLVFVAFTFNPKALGTRERNLAQQTFADLLMVLVVALMLLLPNVSIGETAGLMIAAAVFGLVQMARNLRRLLRSGADAAWNRTSVRRHYGLSLLGHLGVLVAGVLLLWQGGAGATMRDLLLLGPMALLVSGCRSAWLLVVSNAGERDGPAAPGEQ